MSRLESITCPADLRGLSYVELDELAAEIRDFIVQAVAVAPSGHLGSNLGAVELTLALHRVFDSPRDILLWDTGHQAYVHKLVTGRQPDFATLRRQGGLSGYPNRTDPGGSRGLDDYMVRDFHRNIGAEIMRRNKFGPQRGRRARRATLRPSVRGDRDAEGVVQYAWDEAAGQKGLEAACEFITQWDGTANGRLRGMLFPLQVDTCSRELLRATTKAAEELRVPVQIHTGQNLMEFHQTLRQYRRTPVELLDETGLLGARTTLGHCIMVSGHPQAHYPDGRDLERIAAAHANVAHCPVSLGRRGMHLHHLSDYLRRGINVGLGTDIHPFDLIREMRDAGLICKVAAESPNHGTAREVFQAATIGGATALGRDDLGRLAPGAKADVVIINQQALHYGVIKDPIRSLVDCGVASDVESVIVDGQLIMEHRQVPGAPPVRELLGRAQAFAEFTREFFTKEARGA